MEWPLGAVGGSPKILWSPEQLGLSRAQTTETAEKKLLRQPAEIDGQKEEHDESESRKVRAPAGD